MLRGWTSIGPGAEEQLQKAMAEDIEKPRKRVIARIVPLLGFDGGVERQRALRAEEPKEAVPRYIKKLQAMIYDSH